MVLRDHSGIVQLLISRERTSNFDQLQSSLKATSHIEATVSISGVVQNRPLGMINREMFTGEVEVAVEKMSILNLASRLPFTPTSSPLV